MTTTAAKPFCVTGHDSLTDVAHRLPGPQPARLSGVRIRRPSSFGHFSRCKGRLPFCALLLSLLFPASAWSWTLNDQCELTRETPQGKVIVVPGPRSILLYLPHGLARNDAWVTIRVGSRNWQVPMLDDAVELVGMVNPFRDDEWFRLSVDRKEVLSFSLEGSSSAWKALRDCESTPRGGGWLALSGEITGRAVDRIARAIRFRRPEGLLLDSTGGSAQEARRIGSIIRSAGLGTKVQANAQCFSECSLILAAGTPRTVEAGAHIGIPSALITGGLGVFGGMQGTSADNTAYFEHLGVDARKLALLSTTSKPGDIRVLTSEELREVRLADDPTPHTEPAGSPSRPPDPEVDNWWLLGGLFGIGALGWGLTRPRRKG